jgi:hypothetical protein
MKRATCPWEDKVRQGLAEGGGNSCLRDHAARCPVCRDVLALSDWMREFRDLTLDKMNAGKPPLEPWELWDLVKAGKAVNLEAANKVLKPIVVYRKIAWLVSVSGGVALALLEFDKIKSLLASAPGLNALAAMLSKAGETGAASPVQQAVLPAALGLAAVLVLVLATGIPRAKTG